MIINDIKYKKITRTVGHKINEHGIEVPVKKQFYGKTKKECIQKYQEYLAQQKLGVETTTQYFGILADTWLYDFLANDNRIKDTTKNLYISTWNKYIKETALYHLKLSQVTPAVLQKTYKTLDCPYSALETVHKVMRRFYKYLEREGYSRDMTGSLVLPKNEVVVEEKTIITWSDEEINKIFSSFSDAHSSFRLRFFIVLAYYTGARINELLALKYSDFSKEGVRINKQVIYIPTFEKNKRTQYALGIDTPKSPNSVRTIPLTQEVLRELELHKYWHKKDMLTNGYRTDYVFTTKSGKLYDDKNVSVALNRYYKRIDIECKPPHTYRHTFGTSLCKKGVRIEVASKLLGHSDISVTAKYYVDISYDDKLAAVDALSRTEMVK